MHILFVCTGNTCRSPMAEVVAKAVFPKEGYTFSSAGLGVMEPSGASENACLAVEEVGLDLRNHQSHQITLEDIQGADLILTMTNGHKQALSAVCQQCQTPLFTLSEFAGKPEEEVTDPYGCSLEGYRRCLEQITSLVRACAQVITK